MIAASFRDLLALEQLHVEDRPAVLRACEWHVRGMDFADALHLASSSAADCLVTFDQRFAVRAEAAGARPEVEALSARRRGS